MMAHTSPGFLRPTSPFVEQCPYTMLALAVVSLAWQDRRQPGRIGDEARAFWY